MVLDSSEVFMDQRAGESVGSSAAPPEAPEAGRMRRRRSDAAKKGRQVSQNGLPAQADSARAAGVPSVRGVATPRPPLRRPLSLETAPQPVRRSQELVDRRPLQPPWRSGTVAAPSPPARSLTSPSLGSGGGWMRRSESTCSVNHLRSGGGRMRPATSLPHIARGAGTSSLPAAPRPCLLVALRPLNLEQEKHKFFDSSFSYEPQFEYMQPEPKSVLEKYCDGSGLFLEQAVGIMECVLRKFSSYENFEEATGGSVLPKSQVWAAVRKYLQKEGCTGEVVVRLSDELLSQAVMVVESCRPTLTINLAGARQHWLEGMLRHEIGTHYLRGFNNNLQPWATSEGRKQMGLKPANPTEEGLASLHSVLLRKQPYLWRAALLYYTVFHAASMSFSQLFGHIGRFVQDPDVRWEYCLRAKRGQTDTSQPGCFSKDQVYLDGILRILRHRRSIDFKTLTSLGKVSFEDVERLRQLATFSRTRVPHFMRDQERYLQHLDHIVAANELDDAALQQLLPEPSSNAARCPEDVG
ncbi:microtubule-associated tyrosine carboxypeptidase 1 isoform X2 [Nelusetta ayraudi]